MSKGFTPLIGLAVVVALALAAVFGALSIANPAMAAIGQPADAELTERTFAPAAPTGLVTRGGANSVHFSWNNERDPSDTATNKRWFGATGWEFRHRADIANEPWPTWTTGTTSNLTVQTFGGTSDDATSIVYGSIGNLTEGQDYQIQVRLEDANGPDTTGDAAGLPSAPSTATSPGDAAPTGTFEVKATAVKGGVKLDYGFATGVTPGGGDVTGWEYQVRNSCVNNTPTATTGLDANDTDCDDLQADSQTPVDVAAIAWYGTPTRGWMPIPNSADGETNASSYVVPLTNLVSYDFRVSPVADETLHANIALTNPGGPAGVTPIRPDPDRLMLGKVSTTAGNGKVTLLWDRVPGAKEYTYTVKKDASTIQVATKVEQTELSTISVDVSNLTNGTEYTFEVTAKTADSAANRDSEVMTVKATPMLPAAITANFTADSNDPGKNTRYTFKFSANQQYIPGFNPLSVQFHEDFTVPGTISESSVSIQIGSGGRVYSPASVLVDGEEIILQLGDLNEKDDDTLGMIAERDVVTITLRPTAGVKNPVEGGDFDEDIEAQGEAITSFGSGNAAKFNVIRKISLAEESGGRNTPETVTGKGFKNGTSVTFLRMNTDSKVVTDADFADPEVASLCSAVAADGVASCQFTVTSPLFQPGMNYINAFDGRSNTADESKAFELEPSIGVSPKSGSPGESLLIQLYDFTGTPSVTAVNIARRTLCNNGMLAADDSDKACGASGNKYSGTTGSFRLVLPNRAPLGVQDLQVKTTGGADNTNIVISGPLVTSTPSTVLANQRVSLVGTGFAANAKITEITFAGDVIPDNRYGAVTSDGAGNWNASVNLPLTTSTVSAGTHAIQVKDDEGRVGTVDVTVPERSVNITPTSGRVGTIAVVRGENFPSKNDEGTSFNVTVEYGSGTGGTTVTAVPDASGTFEVQLRIPTTAAIPSTNDVSVTFDQWTMNVTHDVPEGIVTLSETSGGPGTTITISGEGFRSYVPVATVFVGSIEVTPAPKPYTDVNGMLSFDVVVPGMDVGIQTVEVKVGQTTASAGFTVTESGVAAGEIRPTAEAIEALGDNLVSVWHFNNDTKVWAFYSPALGEDNTLTHMVTGETYLIQVSASQEVILNRDTRSLTCVGDNCWNQIVW